MSNVDGMIVMYIIGMITMPLIRMIRDSLKQRRNWLNFIKSQEEENKDVKEWTKKKKKKKKKYQRNKY